MSRSMRSFTSFLKTKKELFLNFDYELFQSYFDMKTDVFADLCEIWLWFPASSASLGWNEESKSEYFIDRSELVVYILYLRETENSIKSLNKLLDAIVELNSLCQIIKIRVKVEMEEAQKIRLRTLVSKKLKSLTS